MIGQILINLTKMTSARILVTFLLTGIFLEAIGVFEHIKNFAQAGATIPILGFGSNLAKGAIEGAKSSGLFGALTGGVKAAARAEERERPPFGPSAETRLLCVSSASGLT